MDAHSESIQLMNTHTSFYISLSHSTAQLRFCGLFTCSNTPHLIRETSIVFFSMLSSVVVTRP
jgi:hypothetical protein